MTKFLNNVLSLIIYSEFNSSFLDVSSFLITILTSSGLYIWSLLSFPKIPTLSAIVLILLLPKLKTSPLLFKIRLWLFPAEALIIFP